MKKMILIFSVFVSLAAFGMNPKIEPVVNIVKKCLAEENVVFCNNNIKENLMTLDLDARGDFVFYLKELFLTNDSEKIIDNLYEKIQELIPFYEKIDGTEKWSVMALKNFLSEVSIRFVVVSPIDSEFYIKLYKSQALPGGRYNLLTTLYTKSNSAKTIFEIEHMIKFAEYAKNYSRSIGDESYFVSAAVALVRKMTLASIQLRPGFEGIYKIKFDSDEVNNNLKIDNIVIMESNDRDALVVNFVASDSRIIKIAFNQSGLLGNTFFSNEYVYNNDNDQNIQSPFFKMEVDRKTNAIVGYLSSIRYGKSKFSGKLVRSNIAVYNQFNIKGLKLSQLVGNYKVKVGDYDMTLVINKRSDDASVFEGGLFNDNALISFSKLTFNSEKGILSFVDSTNKLKLTLGVVQFSNSPVFKGEFLNAPQAKIFNVESK